MDMFLLSLRASGSDNSITPILSRGKNKQPLEGIRRIGTHIHTHVCVFTWSRYVGSIKKVPKTKKVFWVQKCQRGAALIPFPIWKALRALVGSFTSFLNNPGILWGNEEGFLKRPQTGAREHTARPKCDSSGVAPQNTPVKEKENEMCIDS